MPRLQVRRRAGRPLVGLLASITLIAACSGPSSSDGADAKGPADTSSPAAIAAAADDVVAEATALPALHAEPDPEDGGRIVDADGRQVLLRGVNVNALAEYWKGNQFDTTFPLTGDDVDTMSGIGWNTVRLLVSWSKVEPEPGTYDEGYLAQVDSAIDKLAARGIYTIVDLHQDAWGPTLAARPDENCEEGARPALGWDGAPGWATLAGDDLGSRCATAGIREISPAVLGSFDAFWADAPGPGGVGIRTRYVAMLAHLAERWADRSEVAGYDLMNEPNAFSDETVDALGRFYGDALPAIRAAEAKTANGFEHLVVFEPPAIWSSNGTGPPGRFAFDDNVVYAPHLYTGGFTDGPITQAAFDVATKEAVGFGGAPVLSGEWGADPNRAGSDGDGYFVEHQRLQDDNHFSATLWTWRESCGDPHKVGQENPVPWGEFDVDCATNEPTGMRTPIVGDLTRAYVRAAPGRLDASTWDPDLGSLTASGNGAEAGITMVAFVPGAAEDVTATVEGLGEPTIVAAPDGGSYVVARTTAADWSITVAPKS